MEARIRYPAVTAWVSLMSVLLMSDANAVAPQGCDALADPRESSLTPPPPGTPHVTCAAFFPFAVSMDGTEATRVEVRIEGTGISAAALGNQFSVVGLQVDGVAFPQTGGFIELYDDGTRGDRVAGDGTWTRGGITVTAVPLPEVREADFDLLRVTRPGGTQTYNIHPSNTPGQGGPARLGQIDPLLRAAVRPRSSRLWTTGHVAFLLEDRAFAELRWLIRARPPTADIQSVTRTLYEHVGDAFDFVVLMPGAYVPAGFRGVYLSSSNDVSGIGRPIGDDSANWGSAGRLQSVLPLSFSSAGPVLHEINHRWGMYIGADLGFQQCAAAHMGIAGAGCGPVGGFDASTLVDNGDGTWSADLECFSAGGPAVDSLPMSPLNLYLAGLIPPSAVPPMPVPVNVDCASVRQDFVTRTVTFAADGMATRTIDQLIASAGPRIPDHTGSQRDFALAWVVPINRRPTDSEAGWFEARAEYLGREAIGDRSFRLTFWEHTGGRATLDTRVDIQALGLFGDGFE